MPDTERIEAEPRGEPLPLPLPLPRPRPDRAGAPLPDRGAPLPSKGAPLPDPRSSAALRARAAGSARKLHRWTDRAEQWSHGAGASPR